MSYKICFRGDSRHPTDYAAIFTNGFLKREPGFMNPEPRWAGLNKDIDPVSAVCFSARLSGAALFPLFIGAPAPPDPNYIYMMAIDTGDIFNTHNLQVGIALEHPDLATQPNAVMWPLFAQELAANNVPGTSIIAAISFTRTFHGHNWSAGGTYTLGTDIVENPNCNVPADIKGPAMDFLREEVAHYRVNQPLPTIPSGFHRSTKL